MVNTGKPSRGCATCKKRKIKCDQTEPNCTACLKSGWTCPGIPCETEINFRNQTPLSIRRSRLSSPVNNISFTPDTVLAAFSKPGQALSCPLEDVATSFFLHHYVYQGLDEGLSSQNLFRGSHEYIPALLAAPDVTLALKSIVAAAGLAALVNAGNSETWRLDAYRLYTRAIRQLRDDLSDPVRKRMDYTLAAVMLMGTFEVIASGDSQSMKSFGQHSLAAALCIEMRGRSQFKSKTATRLFMQMRRIIVQTCHQMQEPIPYALQRWSSWAETIQSEDEFYSNRFSEINERLASYRAAIKHDHITAPSTISSRLLQFDEEFESWRRNLPPTWEYKSYRSVHNVNNDFNGVYDMYPDLWIASTWNSYRSVRLMLHETIIVATLQHGSDKEKGGLGYSMSVLEKMSEEICNSSAYFLGFRRRGTRLCGPIDTGAATSMGHLCNQAYWDDHGNSVGDIYGKYP
ncbi:hypothetical protein TrVGV298_008208 [Trichoderma virens]|nr:hypothetical protein TrVGV298_008208 [Trichoderma virens]